MDLDDLIGDLRARHVVCPKPRKWAAVHRILTNGNRINLEIPNPLILAAWGSSDAAKSYRFSEHLKIASELGVLSRVIDYLNNCNQDDFLYSEGAKRGEKLNCVGYEDLLVRDWEISDEILKGSLVTLEKIQSIDSAIIDEESLYTLFMRYDFYPYNEPKVERGQSVLVDLLNDLGDAFDRRRTLLTTIGENLEEFCSDLFDLKKRNASDVKAVDSQKTGEGGE